MTLKYVCSTVKSGPGPLNITFGSDMPITLLHVMCRTWTNTIITTSISLIQLYDHLYDFVENFATTIQNPKNSIKFKGFRIGNINPQKCPNHVHIKDLGPAQVKC